MDTNLFALGIVIVLISCLTDVSCQGPEKCLGDSNYCPGQTRNMKAICKDGYCFCTNQDYDYNTCLPDAYGCKIVLNENTALAKPQYRNRQPETYSCTPGGNSSTQYEVHVLGVHEAVERKATVEIVGPAKTDRPIILVLGSYQPVNWTLKLPAGITISKVILVAHYIDASSVSGDVNQVQEVERKDTRDSKWSRGFGSDLGGSYTVGLLRQMCNMYGVITSFTGTYRANEWTLALQNVSSPTGSRHGNLSTDGRTRCCCNDCPGNDKMNATCKDGYCFCSGKDYDPKTCLPDAYGCKIVVNTDAVLAIPRYNKQRKTTYSCAPQDSSTQYEVHVLTLYEVTNKFPPKAGNATVNIISRGNSDRPIILVLGNYEPVNWILDVPADTTISKVILVSNYGEKSSVSGVNLRAVEQRRHRWGVGFIGSDISTGGDTVELLRQVHDMFGVVTSFTGTYKADEWTLEVSGASPHTPSSSSACTHKTMRKLNGFLLLALMIINKHYVW